MTHPAQDSPQRPAAGHADDLAEAPSIPGYAWVSLLGAGGFGRVYRARRLSDGMDVAIKVARTDVAQAAEILDREEEALRWVDSADAPHVIDSGRTDCVRWLAMACVPGVPLSDHLQGTPMALEEFLVLARAIVRALAGVHACGVAHGDVKPDNVLIASDGSASWLDFGLARRIDTPAPAALDEIVGTAEYMSPEQCNANEAFDLRSDVYSIGVIVYQLLAGTTPFSGSVEELREAHRSRRPPPLIQRGVHRDIPPAFDKVVARCLAKNPEQRFASASELLAALEDVLTLPAAEPEPAPAPAPAPAATPSAPAASPGASPKQIVGLVVFASRSPAVALRRIADKGRGQLAHARAGEYVAAFTNRGSDNPVRAALAAAHSLIDGGLAERALVDVAAVTVKVRTDGRERIVSSAFAKANRKLGDDAPRGLLATERAALVLDDLECRPVEGRPDLRLLGVSADALDATRMRAVEEQTFGRAGLLATLEAGAGATEDGSSAITTVVGARGIGKSHLARAIVNELTRGGQQVRRVLAAKAPEPVDAASPPLSRALLAMGYDLPTAAPADAIALLRDRLDMDVTPEFALGIQLAMGWIDSAHPSAAALRAAPGALRTAVSHAVGELLRQLAGHRALAIVIDDAHFADDVTLDALEYAALREHAVPIWICVLVRPGFDAGRTAFGSRAAHHEQIELPPLARADAAAFVRHQLAPAKNVSGQAVDHIVERTDAIPLLMVELVAALKRDGLVRPAARGQGWVLDTDALEEQPDLPLVQWLLQRELESLPPMLAEHARLASILGPTFVVDDLAGLVTELERAGTPPASELDAAVGARRLRRSGSLVERPDGSFAFRHELLREAAYASVPESRRRTEHDAAFRYFLARGDDSDVLPQLAFHAARAGLREQAAELLLRLGDLAQQRHAYLEAESHYRRALDELDGGDQRKLAAVRGRGLMRFRLGRHEDAITDLRQAAELAEGLERITEAVGILLDIATVQDWTQDYRASSDLAVRARSLAGDQASAMLTARIILAEGRSQFRLGGDSAGETLARAAEAAAALGDDAYETRVIALLLAAPLLALTGHPDRSRAMFEELLALCRSHGDQLHLATTYLNRSLLWMALNDADSLCADLRRSIKVARAAGFPLIETRALSNLGDVSYMAAKYDEAVVHAQEAIDLGIAIAGRGQCALESWVLLARCQLLSGDHKAAQSTVADIRAEQRRLVAVGDAESDFVPAQEVYCQMVELAVSEASTDAWTALLERAERETVQQERIEILEVFAAQLGRSGQVERARECISRALKLAEGVAPLMRGRLERRAASISQAG